MENARPRTEFPPQPAARWAVIRRFIEEDEMHTPHDDDIRDRAYALWNEAGSPDGRDEEFWHRAARELSEEHQVDTSQTAAEVTQPLPPAGILTH